MKIELLPHQYDAINSDHKFTLLLGGIGSGKTFCGSAWVMKMFSEYPDSLGLITAVTYGQLRKATLNSLFNNLTQWGISFSYNQMSSTLTIEEKKKFLCVGMDAYDNLRGIEIGEWWADELAYAKEEAFDMFCGRLRDKKGPLRVLCTTTPNGFNFLYDTFQGEKSDNRHHRTISATTKSNKHLPSDYYNYLSSQFSEKQIEQELEGKFVSLNAGKCYYAFERELNVSTGLTKLPGTIFVGMDFNISPMCAVVLQYYNDTIRVIDEIFLKNSDTYQMVNALQKKGYNGATVIPDSTASARKTSGISDLNILKESGFTVMPTRNPFVSDRVNAINARLRNQQIIISDSCKKLIQDLEQVTWKGNQIDQKTNPMLSHISDAMSYAVWKLMPLKSKPRQVYMRDR